ncbi:MAG: hypothetical protein GY927_01245 [bacterium]|nr:hypothetical protein [bacterium]
MSRAFFYKERRLAFVVISLASWFGVLGLVGQYLPANASVKTRQMTINMHGNKLSGHWTKKNGRWYFLKISKVSKLKRTRQQRAVPVITASIPPSKRRKVKKKALRAALADEIGRWSKIGDRWEWRTARTTGTLAKTPVQSQKSRRLPEPSQIEKSKETVAPFRSFPEPHWVRRDGHWSFEAVEEHTILRNI